MRLGAAPPLGPAARLEIEPRTFDVDPAVVETRKETLRRVWRYEAVDHIPVQIDLSPACGVTLRESQLETDAWFTSAVRRIEWSLELLPDDYVPLAEPPWLGFYTVPKMLGAQLWWSDDLDAFPGVREPLVREIGQLEALQEGDPRRDGVLPEALRRLEIAARCFPPEVALGGVDVTSPLGDVMELMDQTLFFVALKRWPDAIHEACETVLRTQLAVQDAVLATVGDADRLAARGNWPTWRPEYANVLVTDDIAGLLSPSVFERFDRPYTDRLFERLGDGLLHVCGPHPAVRLYLRGRPFVAGHNCSYRFSHAGFAALKEELGPQREEAGLRRGHLEVMWERGVPLGQQLAEFRAVAEAFAPDVVAIPYCQIVPDGGTPADEITAFYRDMRAVAEQYAARVRWDG